MPGRQFPPNFLWGVATSSYQIEGSVNEGGRGESIWDRFSRSPGKVLNGDTGDVACDHYHRWPEDVELMAELGVKAYRFSIAWPRIFPDGGTDLNRAGLDYYERLVDALLQRGIAPCPTLYHWDLPQALQERGGWTNRDVVDRFAHYAETMFRALGDRVRLWMTHNEPWVASFLGHFEGKHAPGMTDLQAALRAAHHILLSHGDAVHAFRTTRGHGAIGIVLDLHPIRAVSDSEADRRAARAADGYRNRWFLDPVLRGRYPDDLGPTWDRFGAGVDFVEAGDLERISAPIDFLGVNYYFPERIRAARAGLGWSVAEREPATPTTAMGWEVDPSGLAALLLRLRDDYGPMPVYVTENGASFADELTAGAVHDPERIDYLRRHFGAAHDALVAGVDLRGYFVWSLLDNFEWSFGYSQRFGIVYVDYGTLERIPKDSYHFYREVIATNGF
jgi:beta-glucosidase